MERYLCIGVPLYRGLSYIVVTLYKRTLYSYIGTPRYGVPLSTGSQYIHLYTGGTRLSAHTADGADSGP